MPFWKQSGFSYAGGDNTATIASTITLHDNMTAVLNRQANAANTLLNRFSALDTATDSFDPSAQWAMANGALSEMAEYMGRLVSLTQENNSQLSRMSDNIENMGQQMQRSTDQAGSLTSVLKRAAAAFGGITAVQKVFDLSDTLTSTTARLDLMNDGLQTTAQLSQQIFQSAQRSRGSYQTTADAVSKLGLMAGDAFDSSGEIVAFMEQINKQFTIAGTETAGIEAAMLQLTQAMGSGVLRGEEYNSVLEQAPNIIQSIADYLDVPKGKLKDMAADGKITADIVKNAIFAATDETNAKFNSMPQTMAQGWTSFKNQALSAFQPVLQQINELVNSEKFQTMTQVLLDSVVLISGAALNVMNSLAEIGSYLYNNWSALAPVVLAIAAAIAIYNLALVANKICTAAAKWAQDGYNVSMALCPALWVAVAVMALVAAVMAFTNYVNQAYGLSLSFSGMIGGTFMVILAACGNAVIMIYNFVVESLLNLWNCFAKFANFLVNVFTDPIGSIVRLFVGLFDTILSVIESVAGAIGGLFGQDWSSGIQGFRDQMNSAVEQQFGKGTIDLTVDEKQWSLDYIDYNQAFDTGYTIGDSMFGNGDLFDSSADFGTGSPTGTADDPIHTSVDNDVNIADEDLQLMRDVAEARYVQNFVTLTPTVQVSGNTINEKVDVNTVVDEIENRLTNEIAASAEGAYG